MIRAAFFDIDGTLLSYNTHKVLPGTIDAFRQMRSKGVKTFICSGRPRVLIPKFPVDFDGYITVNGGYCVVDDQVLLRNPIDADNCARWMAYVKENDITTMWFTDNDMYINRIDDVALAIQRQLGIEMPMPHPIDSLDGKDIFQFIAIQPASRDADVVSKLPGCRLPRWHNAFTDIVPLGSSKAVGIEKILSHFGINRQDVVAFGDGANDIEMLEYVGCGVAMGNAADVVKSHADMVTDDADSEGIANALKKLGLIF